MSRVSVCVCVFRLFGLRVQGLLGVMRVFSVCVYRSIGKTDRNDATFLQFIYNIELSTDTGTN